MSAYIKTLKNTDGDIIYPQTKTSAVYTNEGVNIEKYFKDADTTPIENSENFITSGGVYNSLIEKVNNIVIVNEYSDTSTYALGAYCNQLGVMYKCTTAITSPEAWNAAHWTATTVAAELLAIIDNVSRSVYYRSMTLEQLNSAQSYSYIASAASLTGFGPYTNFWSVEYVYYDIGYSVQTITAITVTGDRYYRIFVNGTPEGWKSLSYHPLQYDVDFNTFIQDGVYQAQYYSTGCPNSPDSSVIIYPHFFVQVFHHADNWIVQIAHQVNGEGTYKRNCFDNVWQPWRKLTTNEPPTEYDLPLASGYTTIDGCTYFKTQDSVVTVIGNINHTGGFTKLSQIANLPIEYRPVNTKISSYGTYVDGYGGGILIYPNGGICLAQDLSVEAIYFTATFVADN